MNADESRYNRAVRRSLRSGPASPASTHTKVARAAIAGAMIVVPVACGTGDEAAFSIEAKAETTVADSAPIPTEITIDTPTTTALSTTAPSTPEPSTPEPSDTTFPTGAEMLVSFTYQSESGQAKRPYIAVWIEDTDGNLVDTISLWFDQGRKGTKWLNDLTQWYGASGGSDTTMSGATRVPDAYTVAWDGTDSTGEPVAVGEYVLNIESAREHGPNSFTSGTVTVSADGFIVTLDDNGELSSATAELTV